MIGLCTHQKSAHSVVIASQGVPLKLYASTTSLLSEHTTPVTLPAAGLVISYARHKTRETAGPRWRVVRAILTKTTSVAPRRPSLRS